LATSDGFTLLNSLSNKGIRDEIKQVLGKLESFGMVFCETDQLAATFQKMMTGSNKTLPSETKKESGKQTAPGRRLITAKDIRMAADNNQDAITLAPGGLITPLARDQAREYAIRIDRADTRALTK
jgi:hypothetical protein